MASEKTKRLLIIGGILLILFAFFGFKNGITSINTVQGNWDISKQVREQGLEKYLVEEADFDYSHPGIQQLAKNIKSTTSSPYDAAKFTAKYVYDNIPYKSDVSVSYCYQETASSTLEAGTGDCVSMTRMNVAILRAMGIPARSVGGCLKSSQRCTPLFAAYPGVEAQVTQMIPDDFKKRGFLHEWLEAWVGPEKGWITVEATSGQLFSMDGNCNQYIKYGYDSNQFDRCVITSQSFWDICKSS